MTTTNTTEMSNSVCGTCGRKLTRKEAKLLDICQDCTDATSKRMQSTTLSASHRHVGTICQRDGVISLAVDCQP